MPTCRTNTSLATRFAQPQLLTYLDKEFRLRMYNILQATPILAPRDFTIGASEA